jgi:nitroreductase
MILDAILKRRSIRAFLKKPVEEDKLFRVLEAGRLAPSAKNKQAWKFIVVRDPVLKRQIAEASRKQLFIADADCVIVACATDPDYVMMCGQNAYPIDLAIAVDHMTLQATAEGLGTCWIGAFDEQKVKEILGIPGHIRVPILFPLGYPETLPPPRPRKPLHEILFFEKWGETREIKLT